MRKLFAYVCTAAVGLVTACGGCAHTPTLGEGENGSGSLLECLEVPEKLMDHAPKLMCTEQEGSACCAYDINGTPCVILLCSTNCGGWMPPLIRCLTPEEEKIDAEVMPGVHKPQEISL